MYIREAHPTDGWQVPANQKEKIFVTDPKSLEERQRVAEDFAKQFEVSIPILVDRIDDKVGKAYSASPDRLYVIDAEGKVAYCGEPGPRGFQPKEIPGILDKLIKK